MTKIRIESDAASDKGKSFAGQKIKIVPKRKRSSGSSSRNSSKVRNTTVYIVSDSPSDVGKTFDGQKILSPKEFEEIRRSKSNVSQRDLTAQEKAKLEEQRKAELAERSRREQELRQQRRQETLQKLQGSSSQQLSQNIRADVASELSQRQQSQSIQQTQSIQQPLPQRKETFEEFQERTMVLRAPEKKTYDDPNKTKLGNKLDEYSDKIKEVHKNFQEKANNEIRKYDKANPLKSISYNTVSYGAGLVVAFKESIIDPIRTPVKSAKAIIEAPVELATKESARDDFSRKAGEFGQRLQAGDTTAASQLTVAAISPKVPGAVIKTAGSATRATRFIGKTEVPVSDYVHPDVTAGKNQMPSAKGTAEIIEGYERAGGKVVTFSPQKLGKVDPETGTPTSNPLKGRQQAGDTRKGALGMEDGGINVAPKGQGTTYFLRMGDEVQETKYTLNPKKILESVKAEFQTPTVTEFQAKGVVRPPKNVLEKPGFEAVKTWQKEQLAGTGQVAVTKRSMIGQGELLAQRFSNERKGGKSERELGTSEYELTIPQGQEFTQTGIDKYIKVDGKKVAVREADLVVTKVENAIKKPNQKVIDAKKLLDEQKTVSSYLGARPKYKSPLGEYSRLSQLTSNGKSPLSKKGYGSQKSNKGGSSGSGSIPIRSYGSSSVTESGGSSGGGSNPGGGGSGGGSSGSGSIPIRSYGPPYGGGSVIVPPAAPAFPRLPGFKGNNKRIANQGYNVYVRENGKKIKANDKPLPYNAALKRGKDIVDNTVAASFELEKRGRTSIPDIPFQSIGNKFTEKKTKNALRFVEKSKHRIDTLGEKQGLTTAKYLKRFKL